MPTSTKFILASIGRTLIATCLSLGMLTHASAAAVTQWSGVMAIACQTDIYGVPCINGTARQTDSGFSATGAPIHGNGSLDSHYSLDFFGHMRERNLSTQWSAGAAVGALRAGSFSSFVIDSQSFVNPFEGVGSMADANFRDTWVIHNPSSALRRITAHFTFNGFMGDTGGIALPFNQVNASFGNARADFAVDFGLTGGVGHAIVVSSPSGTTGAIAPSVGFGLHRVLNDASPNTQSLEFVFDVADGNELNLFSHLLVSSSISAYADFTHTATLDYILAPDDLDITTSSGLLTRQGDRFVYAAIDTGTVPPEPPTGTVPEPATGLLTLCGLACLSAFRRPSAP